jgi:hypothetical protein
MKDSRASARLASHAPRRDETIRREWTLELFKLPTDRCHLNDSAISINRHHRGDTAVGEEYMVERTISVH